MSVKVMGLVWEIQGLTSAEKLVLLAYADHAHHDGTGIWPAVDTVASKASLSRRTVQRVTRELEKKGWLVQDGHHESGTNLWKIPTPDMGGDTMTPPGVTPRQGEGDTMTPKPSFNHQVNRQEEEEGATNIFQLYESSIGPLTGSIGEELKTLEKDYALYWIEEAFEISKKNNAKSLNYVKAVLQRMKDEGFKKGGKKKGLDLSAFDKVRQKMEEGWTP